MCVHLHFYGRFNVEYPRSPQARTRLTEKGNAAIACFVFFSLPSLYRVFLLPNTLCEIRKWQPFQRFRLILVDFIGYFFSPRHQLATLFRPRKKATKQKKNQSGRRCPLPWSDDGSAAARPPAATATAAPVARRGTRIRSAGPRSGATRLVRRSVGPSSSSSVACASLQVLAVAPHPGPPGHTRPSFLRRILCGFSFSVLGRWHSVSVCVCVSACHVCCWRRFTCRRGRSFVVFEWRPPPPCRLGVDRCSVAGQRIVPSCRYRVFLLFLLTTPRSPGPRTKRPLGIVFFSPASNQVRPTIRWHLRLVFLRFLPFLLLLLLLLLLLFVVCRRRIPCRANCCAAYNSIFKWTLERLLLWVPSDIRCVCVCV